MRLHPGIGVLSTAAMCLLGEQQARAATVTVDMQPCILTPSAIIKDDAATPDAYLTSVFYQGYWAASQLALVVGSGEIGLTNSETSGKCNVVYVGIVVTEAQKLELQEYSANFKVRIVYFNAAETANDLEVNSRLGISQDFTDPLLSAPFIKITPDGASIARVVTSSLQTDPRELNLFARPVHQLSVPTVNGATTIVANYVDTSGSQVTNDPSFPSVAAMTYTSNTGYEELHIFFSIAWFDVGSWAWGHFMVEWGTKGIFQGERRFYVAGVVDDLFLSTGVFVYDGGLNEGAQVRSSAADMEALKDAEASINSRYGSSIMTEFAYNGNGILEEVESDYAVSFDDSDAGLLPKGEPVSGAGIDPILPEGWLSRAVPGMKAEFDSGEWASDDLLSWVLDNMESFWWQSHTLAHLARDNLGQSDCDIEDGGNAQIAVITGLFDSDNYCWRSMTNPGITGLFNQYCLTSAMANLNACGPGDNTYDGVQTTVSLVSTENQFHSIRTTTETNGAAGFQIVPRWASFVYFNCVDGDCLVNENEYIRRIVCGCSNLDPSQDKGSCSSCGDDIQSFGSIEALFEQEAKTATRQILMGRRDKYMFHQANVVPTNLSGGSLLGHWYEEIMAMLSQYIAFPVTSVKFDDMCSEFTLHEELDYSGALLTATVDNVVGDITGLSLSASGTSGYIPLTVPSSTSISTSGLTVGSVTTYGSDTTYYLATDSEAIPTPATAPSSSELAPIPTNLVANLANTDSPAATPVPDVPTPFAPVAPEDVTLAPGGDAMARSIDDVEVDPLDDQPSAAPVNMDTPPPTIRIAQATTTTTTTTKTP